MKEAAVAEAQDALAVLAEALSRVHRIQMQDNWLMGLKATAQPIGSAELNKLGEYLDKAAQPRQLLYVDQRNFRKLRDGEDAEALDGTPIPHDTPLSAVSIVHTPDLRYGVTARTSVQPTEGGVA